MEELIVSQGRVSGLPECLLWAMFWVTLRALRLEDKERTVKRENRHVNSSNLTQEVLPKLM